MFKYLIILLVFYTCSFSKILDVSNPKKLQTLEYISFINDSLNSYSYEDINKKEDVPSSLEKSMLYLNKKMNNAIDNIFSKFN